MKPSLSVEEHTCNHMHETESGSVSQATVVFTGAALFCSPYPIFCSTMHSPENLRAFGMCVYKCAHTDIQNVWMYTIACLHLYMTFLPAPHCEKVLHALGYAHNLTDRDILYESVCCFVFMTLYLYFLLLRQPHFAGGKIELLSVLHQVDK